MLTRVFSLFSKPKKIVIIAREACKLTVDEWRSDPALTKVAYSILNHKDFKSMIDVLKNTGPHTFMMPSISIEERAIWQARIEGFHLCLNTLESLGSMTKPTETLEPTYEPPENPTITDKE